MGEEAVAVPAREVSPVGRELRIMVDMTREEAIEKLLKLAADYDRVTLDRRTERENHIRALENFARDHAFAMEQKDREKAALLKDKDRETAALLEEKDREIANLRKELADKTHSEQSMRQEKFGGKSKRGIEKSGATAKGRDDDKNDFDGTPGSPSSSESTGQDVSAPVSLDDIRNKKAARPTKYTIADASSRIVHDCDMSRLPEGAVLIPGGESVETVFDEKHVIIAHIYKFIRYRMEETVIDGDGNPVKVWREYTMHFPMRPDRTSAGTPAPPMKKGKLPDQVPGTHETPSMLANLIFGHYFCNVPMNRMSRAFREFGVNVGRSTLEHLDHTVARLLKPLHKALLDDVLCDDAVVFCDETWQRLHLNDRTVKVYDWIIGNKKRKAVVYAYDNGSRGRKVIAEILEGRKIKAVHTDGYNVYFFLKDIGVVQICCGAHLWRYLKEWYERTSDPEARALLLDLAELFMMEARLRENNAPPDEVLRQRNAPETLNTISRFTSRVDLLLEKCADIPKIGYRALNYARVVAAKVFRWREDPDYELDNNFAERSARPIATSRKTSLFHCSHEGAENDCVIRSFIETCRLRKVSVVEWFKAFFQAILQGRTDYPNLLPGVLTIE